MANTYTYTQTPNAANPANAPTPLNAFSTMAQGSDLAALINTGANQAVLSDLLKKTVEYGIYKNAPVQYYMPLLEMVSRGFKEVSDVEYTFLETPFGRQSMIVHSWAVDNSGTFGTITLAGTFELSGASIPVAVRDTIFDNSGSRQVLVTAKTGSASNNSSTIVVKAAVGDTLDGTSFVAGDILAFNAAQAFDGVMDFGHDDRMVTLNRWNTIREYQRNNTWTDLEYQRFINNGNTDYLQKNIQNSREQLLTDMMIDLFCSHKGIFDAPMANGTSATFTTFDGLLPTMDAAGAPHVPTTTGGIVSTFKSLAHITNKKQIGGTRAIYCSPEIKGLISTVFKDSKVRYTASDTTNSLDIEHVVFGGMHFEFYTSQLFADYFPQGWGRRILVIDKDAVRLTKMKGLKTGEGMIDNYEGGHNTNTFKKWWYKGNLGVIFNNPTGGFCLDIL